MNKKSLINKIESSFQFLSDANKKLAEYILNNIEEAAFLSASELGKKNDLSESTVIRFSRALDYAGFPELKDAIQEILKKRLAPKDRLLKSISKSKDLEDIVEQALLKDIDNIEKTLIEVDKKTLINVIELVSKARRVYVIGLMASATAAYLLGHYLSYILPDIRTFIYGDSTLFKDLKSIDKGDLMLGICFSRYSRRTVEALEFAKSKGADIIVMTDSKVSPPAIVADYILVAKVESTTFTSSYAAPVGLINALISGIAAENHERTMKLLEQAESSIDNKDFLIYKDLKKKIQIIKK